MQLALHHIPITLYKTGKVVVILLVSFTIEQPWLGVMGWGLSLYLLERTITDTMQFSYTTVGRSLLHILDISIVNELHVTSACKM